MQLPIQFKEDLVNSNFTTYIIGILVILPPVFVEECFPADPKGHCLLTWEVEFLRGNILQIY